MKQKTYSEKLLDPRWQKKRLEVLNSSDWTCKVCGTKSDTLHVHHLWYESKKEPWEYPPECLLCLCEKCHKERQQLERAFDSDVRAVLNNSGLIAMSRLLNAAKIIGQEHRQLIELLFCLADESAPWDTIIDICTRIRESNAGYMSLWSENYDLKKEVKALREKSGS